MVVLDGGNSVVPVSVAMGSTGIVSLVPVVPSTGGKLPAADGASVEDASTTGGTTGTGSVAAGAAAAEGSGELLGRVVFRFAAGLLDAVWGLVRRGEAEAVEGELLLRRGEVVVERGGAVRPDSGLAVDRDDADLEGVEVVVERPVAGRVTPAWRATNARDSAAG